MQGAAALGARPRRKAGRKLAQHGTDTDSATLRARTRRNAGSTLLWQCHVHRRPGSQALTVARDRDYVKRRGGAAPVGNPGRRPGGTCLHMLDEWIEVLAIEGVDGAHRGHRRRPLELPLSPGDRCFAIAKYWNLSLVRRMGPRSAPFTWAWPAALVCRLIQGSFENWKAKLHPRGRPHGVESARCVGLAQHLGRHVRKVCGSLARAQS